jgi:hypothetical protein
VAGQTKPCKPAGLHEVLQSWENQSLWLSFHIDGENEERIFHGLMQGSLIIGHDGSYMPHLANNVCSCAIVIHCQHTGYCRRTASTAAILPLLLPPPRCCHRRHIATTTNNALPMSDLSGRLGYELTGFDKGRKA